MRAGCGSAFKGWAVAALCVLLACAPAAVWSTETSSFLWMYTSQPGPQQIHLSLVGDDAVGITWATLGDHVSGDGFVKYGEADGVFPHTVKATSVSRRIKTWNGKFHYCTLDKLKPATKYYYVVGDEASNEFSAVFSFTSPPVRGATVDFTFAAVGDMGISSEAEQTVGRIGKADALSMVLHTGGLSYAEGDPTRWDEWEEVVEPVAARLPYMVSVGVDDKGDQAYTDRFMFPLKSSGSPSPYFYSFNYGTVHFVSLSTEHPHHSGSEQYVWLEKDLREATKSRTANHWVIVFGNKGMYSSNNAHGSDHVVRDELEELFHKYKVDMCIWAGDHFYERTYPVMHGNAFVSDQPDRYVNPKGIVHLVVGNAGRGLHTDFAQPQPKWSAYREASFGYATVQVMTNDTLYVEYRKNSDGSVGDQVWIAKTGRSSPVWTQHIFASSMLPHASELVRPPPSHKVSPVGVSIIVAVAVVAVFLSTILFAVGLSASYQRRAEMRERADSFENGADGPFLSVAIDTIPEEPLPSSLR